MCCSPCLTSSAYRILFMKLFTSVFRSQHTEAHFSVAERSSLPLWGEGGVIPGKASSTGPTVETAGLCASPLEGGEAQSWYCECIRQGLV